MLLDLIVQIHHMQDVHQLALVLMQALHLHIEDGAGIDRHAIVLLNVLRQTDLVLVLDIHEFQLCLLIIGKQRQLLHLGQIGDPLIADVVRYPPPLGNAVGLVVELLREHVVEVLQGDLLQNLGVQARHAVDGIGSRDRKMSHPHLSVVHDGHTRLLALISRKFPLDVQAETAVDLLYNIVNTRQ